MLHEHARTVYPADVASPSDPAALADLHLGDLLHSNAKTELRTGQFRGRRVLVKRLLSNDTFWRGKFDHQLRIYRAFQTFPPPTRVPELLWTDDHTCMVIEEIPGQVIDDRRYPLQVLPRQIWAAAITAVRTFSMWSPPRHPPHRVRLPGPAGPRKP